MIVRKSKKQTSVYGEMFHGYCSSGWKILKFLEKVEASGAIFCKLEKQQTEYVKFINVLK